MKLISWNVNGIRAIAKKGFLEWMADYSADIVALQETKAHKEQLDESLLNIAGYQAYFSSGIRKGYSGTAVYSKIAPLSVEEGFGDPDFDGEGRTQILEFKDFFLYNVYFPNGQASQERLDYKMAFYESFLNAINEKRKLGKSIVVCGDYNTAHTEIDLAHPKENSKTSGFLPIERAWMDKLEAAGYVDTLRYFYPGKPKLYTWWSMRARGARERNVGWRIDYFYVDADSIKRVKDAFILPQVMGSDHCPVGIDFE